MTSGNDNGSVARPDLLIGLKLLWQHGTAARLPLVASALLATVSVVLSLVPVWAIWQGMADLVSTGSASGFAGFALISTASIVIGWLAMAAAMALSHVAAFRLIHALRLSLARHLVRLPLGWLQGRRSGGAKKLVIDEPERLELLLAHGVPEGVSGLATWVAVTGWLFWVDWRMTIATIILVPVAFGLMVVAMARSTAMTGVWQAAAERMNGAIVECLAGMPVIKVFNRTGANGGEVSRAVQDFADAETEMSRQFLPWGAPFYTLIVANICVILPVGVYLVGQGDLDVATLCFFLVLGAAYSQPLLKLFGLMHDMAHISMATTVIAEVLASPEQVDCQDRPVIKDHSLRFDGVRFSYGEREVLKGVSFHARAGAVTALVGASGSGKSTIASLIPRLHDISGGSVTLGGIDLGHMALDQLMGQVTFVFQHSFLFAGSIADNIRMGRPEADDQAVWAAAVAASAHDFIMALPGGYDTVLGEGGSGLSGGERQRIAIARAILKDAPVIILDEATAFADPDCEAAIQQALSALARGKTLLVVAHRLHTIMNADQIVVIDGGRVAEAGRHDELVALGGHYARLWADYTQAQAITLRPVD